jgi:hypothetical protein
MKHSIDVAVATVRGALAWLPGWLSAVIIVVVLILIAVALHGFGLRLARRSRLGRSHMGRLLVDWGVPDRRASPWCCSASASRSRRSTSACP